MLSYYGESFQDQKENKKQIAHLRHPFLLAPSFQDIEPFPYSRSFFPRSCQCDIHQAKSKKSKSNNASTTDLDLHQISQLQISILAGQIVP